MIEHATYPIEIRWTGGQGMVVASGRDALAELTVASPPEFGGPAGTWSPEHLFVAAIASCFVTTFEAVARISQLPIVALEVAARGELVRGEDRRYRFTRVALEPRIEVESETDVERVLRLLPKAEQACLVSRSVSSEVTVEPQVRVADREPALA